jgi:hypothetical protein
MDSDVAARNIPHMPRHDQRSDVRIALESDVYVVDIESGVEFHADAIDTCRGGLSFHAPMEPALGAEMEVTFPGRPATAFRVLRIDMASEGFTVAGTLHPRWSAA